MEIAGREECDSAVDINVKELLNEVEKERENKNKRRRRRRKKKKKEGGHKLDIDTAHIARLDISRSLFASSSSPIPVYHNMSGARYSRYKEFSGAMVDGCTVTCLNISHGRSVVATRNLSAGHLAFSEFPFAYIIRTPFLRKVCSVCVFSLSISQQHRQLEREWGERELKGGGGQDNNQLLFCSLCRHVSYCSEYCRDVDAERHASECSVLVNVMQLPASHSVLKDIEAFQFILRCIIARFLEERQEKEKKGLYWGNEEMNVEEPETMMKSHRYPPLSGRADKSNDEDDRKNNNVINKRMKMWMHINNLYPFSMDTMADLATVENEGDNDDIEDEDKNWLMNVASILLDIVTTVGDDEFKGWAKSNLVVKDLMLIGKRINMNSYGFGQATGGEDNIDVGVGLYPKISLCNHSCFPSCAFVTSSYGELSVRTLREIKKGDELTLNYIDLYQGREARQRELVATKQFMCSCSRCVCPISESVDRYLEPGVICPQCHKGVLLAVSIDRDCKTEKREKKGQDRRRKMREENKIRETNINSNSESTILSFRCEHCHKLTNGQEVLQLITEGEYDYERIVAVMNHGGSEGITKAKKMSMDFIEKFEKRDKRGKEKKQGNMPSKLVLHPLHPLLFANLVSLFRICIAQDDLLQAVSCCKQIVSTLTKVVPCNIPEVGKIWLALANGLYSSINNITISKIIIKKLNNEMANAFTESHRIFNMTYGNDHHLTLQTAAHLRK